jgi:hypothetical protein
MKNRNLKLGIDFGLGKEVDGWAAREEYTHKYLKRSGMSGPVVI